MQPSSEQVSRILHSSTSQYGIASFPQVNPQMDESVYQNASGPTKDQSTFMIQLYPHCLFMVVSSIANGNRLPEANIPFIYMVYQVLDGWLYPTYHGLTMAHVCVYIYMYNVWLCVCLKKGKAQI